MKLVVGNQKSYMDENKVGGFIEKLNNINHNHVIICPSFIYLDKFKSSKFLLGSQNVSSFDGGANTGEILCEQLKSIGINISIVGHSERRQKLNESNEDINIKIKRLLDNKMTPILCVGESKEEKENGETTAILLSEIEGALKEVPLDLISKIIIAYEPIWSIGTGDIPSNDEIEAIIKYIKTILKDNYNSSNTVLYGGSVNSKNIDELNKIDVVDGYLVGGASAKIDEFLEIINKCQ